MTTTNPSAEMLSGLEAPGRSIRVLYTINGLGTGGAERSLLEILRRLPDLGITPSVIALHRRVEGVEPQVLELGVPVTFLTSRSLRSRIREARRAIEANRPDIVHTTIFDADLVGRLAVRGMGAAVLSSLVNTSYDRVRLRDPEVSRLGLAGARLIDGWTARRFTHHFHAISHAVARAAVRDLRISPDAITVIERGRDPSRLIPPTREIRRAARKTLGIDEADDVLVSVGREEFQKGHSTVIEAMPAIIAARPRAALLIVGRQGAASSALRDVHRLLGLGPRVRFLGHRDDIPSILSAADVFVFPSLYEGLGGAAVEAMAMRLPVVASDIEALREVVEDGASGVLVPPGAAEPLSRAIITLLSDSRAREEMGTRGRDIFGHRFTINRSVSRLATLYRSLDGRIRG
jgi:glycosyltransferase involved in cell wall biosynthesis